MVNEYKYYFRKGSRINIDAEKTWSELEIIKRNNVYKMLEPPEVVDYARENPDSELHKGFEWDDSKAAEQYRLQQARQIIYNIRITKVTEEREEDIIKPIQVEIVPYTHLDGQPGYKHTVEVYKNEDDYNQLKQQAYNDLIYWSKKYSNIVEFEQIYKDIDSLNI